MNLLKSVFLAISAVEGPVFSYRVSCSLEQCQQNYAILPNLMTCNIRSQGQEASKVHTSSTAFAQNFTPVLDFCFTFRAGIEHMPALLWPHITPAPFQKLSDFGTRCSTVQQKQVQCVIHNTNSATTLVVQYHSHI